MAEKLGLNGTGISMEAYGATHRVQPEDKVRIIDHDEMVCIKVTYL